MYLPPYSPGVAGSRDIRTRLFLCCVNVFGIQSAQICQKSVFLVPCDARNSLREIDLCSCFYPIAETVFDRH